MLTKPRILSSWDLLAAGGELGLWAFYQRLLPMLPDPLPTHFDAAGRVNGWTPKAHLPWIVFGLPLYVWLLLLVIGTVSARVCKDPAKAPLQAFFPLRGFLPLGFCALMATALGIPLTGLGTLRYGVGALLLCLALGMVYLLRDFRAYLATQPDAHNFRGGGLFYHNPDDPRLWVEKRIGLGWTLNYARPSAWWLTAVFLALPAAAVAIVLFNLPR
jgi:uncharacterized membrane protein